MSASRIAELRMDTESVIEVRDLVTHYGDRMILKGIDVDIRKGEIMVLVGNVKKVN